MNEFAERRRLRVQRSAATGLTPAYAAFLMKGTRSRLYRIDPIPGGWRCEVFAGGGGRLHRTQDVQTRTHMLALKKQYEVEVADLVLDGWTVV